jgi:hypothetical protein
MKNKKTVLSILAGLVVAASGSSFVAYKFGYSDGFVEASNKVNERWLAQARDTIKENGQFVRTVIQPLAK